MLRADILWLALKGFLRIRVQRLRIVVDGDYIVLHKTEKVPDELEPTSRYQCELLQRLFPNGKQILDIEENAEPLVETIDWMKDYYKDKIKGLWTRNIGVCIVAALLVLVFCETMAQYVDTPFFITVAALAIAMLYSFRFMPVYRTSEARAIADRLESLALYIGMKEKPHKTKEDALREAEMLFPYATALRINRKWKQSLDPELYNMEYPLSFVEGDVPDILAAKTKTLVSTMERVDHNLTITILRQLTLKTEQEYRKASILNSITRLLH